MPHPTILILALLVLTGFLAQGDWSVTLVALGVVLIAHLWRRAPGGLLLRIRRLRWLLLSIVLLYGWFTPGEALLATMGGLSPSVEGVVEGALRALNLAVIVAAVHWVLAASPREGLIQALYALARPLAVLGVRAERAAVRLVLTLEYVARVPNLRAPASDSSGGRLGAMADRAAELLGSTLRRAEEEPCGPVEMPLAPRPGVLQWLGLAALAGLLATASALGQL